MKFPRACLFATGTIFVAMFVPYILKRRLKQTETNYECSIDLDYNYFVAESGHGQKSQNRFFLTLNTDGSAEVQDWDNDDAELISDQHGWSKNYDLWNDGKLNYLKVKVVLLKESQWTGDLVGNIQSLRILCFMSIFELAAIAATFPNLNSVFTGFQYMGKNEMEHPIKVSEKVTSLEINSTVLSARNFLHVMQIFPSLENVVLKNLEWSQHTWLWEKPPSKDFLISLRGSFDSVRSLSIHSCKLHVDAWNDILHAYILFLFSNLNELTIKFVDKNSFTGMDFAKVLSLQNLGHMVTDASVRDLKFYIQDVDFVSPISIRVEVPRVDAEDFKALKNWCNRRKRCALSFEPEQK